MLHLRPLFASLTAKTEDVAQAARESSAKAEAEKKRRLQAVAKEIEEWKSTAEL